MWRNTATSGVLKFFKCSNCLNEYKLDELMSEITQEELAKNHKNIKAKILDWMADNSVKTFDNKILLHDGLYGLVPFEKFKKFLEEL